jgi:oxygen-independent coproporphyrinogen III oxidase
MQSSWHKYLSMRTPRYTSYPSALYFNDSVNAARLGEKLKTVGLYEPLSIYVHIPFCRRLCWYCGCNMRVENNYRRALYYVDALLDEIRTVSGFLGGAGRPVCVHFGGGTPNFLHTDDLERILNTIELELGLTDDASLAIELDPRLIKGDDIPRLAALGFARMSLGVQDLDPEVQKAINRVQSFDMIENCVSAMRQAGVNDVAFDILYGLPKQTPENFARTIEKVIALAPDRLSVFGYAHLPSALPRQRMINEQDLPDQFMRNELAELADEALVSAGYVRIGFDHYAKPDNPLAIADREKRLRRNFQGFTDDIAETSIGLGATAISFINGLYAQNEKDIRSYCSAVKSRRLPASRGVERSQRDEVFASAISRLLCEFKTDLDAVFAQSAPDDVARIKDALDAMENDGVISRRGTAITMNDQSHSLCRAVASAFDPYIYAEKPLAKAI